MYNYNYNTLTQPTESVIRVNGRNGANAYQLRPNSSVLLLDETEPIVWLKVSDGAGYATISGYTITPIRTEEQQTIMALEERIKSLEEKLNESNARNAKQKPDGNNKQ